MKRYEVTYLKSLYETFIVYAETHEEAKEKAHEREENGEPDEESSESHDIEVHEVET